MEGGPQLLLYMAALRTQIYLSAEQRARLDAIRESRGGSLAELIREAVDDYLGREQLDQGTALERSFGSVRKLRSDSAPSGRRALPVAELLVDTDVLVDHLRGTARLETEDRPHDPTITRAELFAGPGAQREAVRTLLEPLVEVPVDRVIAELAGGIREATGTALPDALIAATALHRGVPLMTRNHGTSSGSRVSPIVAPEASPGK